MDEEWKSLRNQLNSPKRLTDFIINYIYFKQNQLAKSKNVFFREPILKAYPCTVKTGTS